METGNCRVNLDAVQTLARAALKIGGGFLVAQGIADQDAVEVIIAGVIALIGIFWGLRHRVSSGSAPGANASRTSGLPLLFALAGLILVVGCASRNFRAFQSERDLLASARSAVSTWNVYSRQYGVPTNSAVSLRVYDSARSLSANLLVVDELRERALTNGVEWASVEAALARSAVEQSNLLWLVEDGMKGR